MVLVNARVAAIGKLPTLPQEPAAARTTSGAPARRQRIYRGGWIEVPVYQLEELAPGQIVKGPALVESMTTAALIGEADEARATEHGWLDIRVGT